MVDHDETTSQLYIPASISSITVFSGPCGEMVIALHFYFRTSA